jgi:hypothetical protein
MPNKSIKTVSLDTGSSTIISVENIGKEDINFPEFCFGVMGRVPLKDQPDELVFVDKSNPEAKIIIQKSRYGLPTQYTRDLRLALMRIAMRKNNFKKNRFQTNVTEILDEMGISVGGKNIKDLKKHLDILVGTRIKFIESFFDIKSGEKSTTTTNFSIMGGYRLVEMEDIRKHSASLSDSVSELYWNEYFYEKSIENARNLINFDYSLYTSLKGDISKQLYSFLNKRSFKKNMFRIDLSILAYEKLGISKKRPFSKIRFALKKSHEVLLKSGFLSQEPIFEKTSNDTEFVVYYFSKKRSQHASKQTELFIESDYEEAKMLLEAIGVTEGQTGRLVKQYGLNKILDSLELMRLQFTKGTIKSPKKWLFACLKNDFDMDAMDAQHIEQTTAIFEDVDTRKQLEIESKALVQSKQDEQNIDQWIGQNPSQFWNKCREFYKQLDEEDFYKMNIDSVVLKTGQDPAEVVMENPVYRTIVRSTVLKELL